MSAHPRGIDLNPDSIDIEPRALTRSDFPALPAGCRQWALRSPTGSTFYVDDDPTTDWPGVLELLNRFLLGWQINANEESGS